MEYYTSYKKNENETEAEKKESYWKTAIGLQEIDHLEPSEYLVELSKENIYGQLSNETIENLLYSHYENMTEDDRKHRRMECDVVANRIVQLLKDDSFTFSPAALKAIHRYLFRGIYDFAGKFRTYNISKKEPVLNGETVNYANFFMMNDTLQYDFEEERKYDYLSCDEFELVSHIARFTSAVWQVHPFGEGNTRTTAVFVERYLNSIGFLINNDMFQKHAEYFRNALVRSNYANYPKGIGVEFKYLERFFHNLLIEDKYELRNRNLN